jgi:hypothetical protein
MQQAHGLASGADEYVILKARIKSDSSKIFALIMVFFRVSTKVAEKSVLIASDKPQLYDFPMNIHWAEMEDTIGQKKWNGEQKNNLTNDLKDTLDNALGHGSQERLFEYFNSNRMENLREEITRIFYHSLNDSSPMIDLRVDKVSAAEFKEHMEARRQRERDDKKKRSATSSFDLLREATPANAQVLEGTFVLSPFKGVPIYALATGDRVFVQLKSSEGSADALYTKLKAAGMTLNQNGDSDLSDSENPPIPGEVYRITVNELGEYIALVHVKDEFFVRILETERINVRRFEGVFDFGHTSPSGAMNVGDQLPSHLAQSVSESGSKGDRFLFILIGLGVISLIILVFIIYQSGIF